MIYKKRNLLDTLQNIDGITVASSIPNKKNNDIAFEWKTRKLILSFKDEETEFLDESSKFSSDFSLTFIYRPDVVMNFLTTKEKYLIANYLTATTKDISSVSFRESKDVFQISAKYNPMIENLSDYSPMSDELIQKNLKYIIMYLLSLCLGMAANLGEELKNLINSREEFLEKMKAF
ncbi:hypothetical protein ACX5DZ_000812 [Enterobacter hormaechei]